MARLPALALSVLAGGCSALVNHEFAPPNQASLPLGTSTEAAIVATEGLPQTEIVTNIRQQGNAPGPFAWAPDAARRYDLLRYGFIRRDNLGGAGYGREAEFILADGRLAGWTYRSTNPADSTDFDEPAAEALFTQGRPAFPQVVALLGPPGGRAAYPLTTAPDLMAASWSFLGQDKATGKLMLKSARVVYREDGAILAHDVRQSEVQTTAAPGPVVVPIVLP